MPELSSKLITHGVEGYAFQIEGNKSTGDCWDDPTAIPADYAAINDFPQPDAWSVYPGAADTWYDGVDADCAGGSDFDQDGDGYDLENDTDDTDASVH